jgi:hypothetical protein
MSLYRFRRPVEVKILTILFVWLALWNSLRLVQAIHFWETLSAYEARGGPLYSSVSGGVWAGAWLALGWALWQGKAWAWGAALGGAAGYGSWAWFDRLIVQEPHGNELFVLVSMAVGLVFVFLLLFSKNVRDFCHER